MKRLLLFFSLFLFVACLQQASSQIKISGQVIDGSGGTIPGVTILEKGTSNGTITDIDGNFNIKVTTKLVP